MALTTKVLFPWKSEYAVQHSGIDGQHQRLVGLVNDLYSAMSEGHGRTAVNHVMTGLTDYTKTHFSYEEQEMSRVAYPDIIQHKEHHRKLLQQVEVFAKSWSNGHTGSVVDLASFLKDWLVNHIGHTDRPLAKYLSAKN